MAFHYLQYVYIVVSVRKKNKKKKQEKKTSDPLKKTHTLIKVYGNKKLWKKKIDDHK